MDGYFQNNSRGGDENDDDNEFFNENAEEINNSSCHERMLVAESESVFRRISKQGFRMGKSIRDERKLQIDFNEGFSSGVALGEACGSYLAAYTHAILVLKKDQESESSSPHTVDRRSRNNSVDQLLHRSRLIFIEALPERNVSLQTLLDQLNETYHFLPERFQLQLLEKKASLDEAITRFYKPKNGKPDR